ncbi:MAG: hypothetical protein R3B60_03735 [Candidatus Paceibacterota bacterium]
MQSKSLLIAIAAFAVTATGVQAYVGVDRLEKAGFSPSQIEALAEARELRAHGDNKKARDILLEAGVDEEKLKELKKLSHNLRHELYESVLSGDYDNFKGLIVGTPLSDIVTTEADFELFKEALKLRQNGEFEEAKVKLDKLGVGEEFGSQGKHHGKKGKKWLDLTPEQQDALMVARQSNDKETIKEILKEAGLAN